MMRLLNAKTMELHSFQDTVPPYAILSHTWHDDEVLFQDLQNMSRAKKKAGFIKIKFCCAQALKDHIEFVWIDTCCIDKSSSAELSEAINSMYRWYQKAKACYAYLRDVSNSRDIESEFRRSRWFKRAWTLQELLAPRNLSFYSADWEMIGYRYSDDIKSIVSEVTGIEEVYLIHRDIHLASISKRMSWAATREATREEDIAYSLFGIFDVNMPLLYGEGRQKAFRRLQEEIMKSSTDHTLFAWILDLESDYDGIIWNRADRILAYSPTEFADAKDLIPIQKNPQNNVDLATPYSMTNLGLRISLPLYFKSIVRDVATAALNCYKGHDLFHVLGLVLNRVGENQFTRHAEDGPILIPTETLPSFTAEEIYIQESIESKDMDPIHPLHLAFVFRKIPDSIRVIQAFPDEYWNQYNKTIQGIYEFSRRESWRACLHLEIAMDEGLKHLVLIMGEEFRSRSGEPGFTQGPWDTRDDSMTRTWCNLLDYTPTSESLAEIYRNFEVSKELGGFCEHQGVRISCNDASRAKQDHPAFVDVMGEWMCVVDIVLCEEEKMEVGKGKISEIG